MFQAGVEMQHNLINVTFISKFVTTKNYEQIEFVLIPKNLGTSSSICYKRTNVMSSDSISIFRG